MICREEVSRGTSKFTTCFLNHWKAVFQAVNSSEHIRNGCFLINSHSHHASVLGEKQGRVLGFEDIQGLTQKLLETSRSALSSQP